MKAFWSRWKKEYLVSLRQFHQHSKLTKTTESSVKVGDVVLVHDTLPHNQWRLAVVKELLPGRDGLVPSVTLRISKGELKHPIEKLYPLEVSEEESMDPTESEEEVNEKSKGDIRPRREAANQAKLKIRQCLLDE